MVVKLRINLNTIIGPFFYKRKKRERERKIKHSSFNLKKLYSIKIIMPTTVEMPLFSYSESNDKANNPFSNFSLSVSG